MARGGEEGRESVRLVIRIPLTVAYTYRRIGSPLATLHNNSSLARCDSAEIMIHHYLWRRRRLCVVVELREILLVFYGFTDTRSKESRGFMMMNLFAASSPRLFFGPRIRIRQTGTKIGAQTSSLALRWPTENHRSLVLEKKRNEILSSNKHTTYVVLIARHINFYRSSRVLCLFSDVIQLPYDNFIISLKCCDAMIHLTFFFIWLFVVVGPRRRENKYKRIKLS